MIDSTREPTRSDLRVFGLLSAVFFAAAGAVARFRFHGPLSLAVVIWGVGAVVTVAYAVLHPLRRPLYLSWMRLSSPLGWIVSHLAVAAVYYLVLTPIGLALRAVGRPPLRQRLERAAATYWTDCASRDVSSYFRTY